MKQRLTQICFWVVLVLVIGILYGIFVGVTGWGVPCVIYEITGFRCPGCGITHMCVAIMQGDFILAMRHNVVLFFLSPILVLVLGDYLIRYIRTGHWKMRKWQNIAVYIMIVILIIFAIVRNIYDF